MHWPPLTFLSVDPSLDFGSGAGADVGVCADGGVGADVVGVGTDAVVGAAGAVGVADVAVAADAGIATATAVPVATFKLGASHAFNAGLGVGPMSIVVSDLI